MAAASLRTLIARTTTEKVWNSGNLDKQAPLASNGEECIRRVHVLTEAVPWRKSVHVRYPDLSGGC